MTKAGQLAWTELRPFGIRIDRDLRSPLSDAECEVFRELFFEHGLLLFQDQALSPEDQRRVGRYVGPVIDETEDVVALDGSLGAGALAFHSDFSFTPKPILALSLHAIDVVSGQSSTRFINGAHAYQSLPAELRAEADRLKQLVSWQVGNLQDLVDEFMPEGLPHIVRDVVLQHPETDKPILYITEEATSSIEGLSKDESDALLRTFAQYLYRPEGILDHRWRNGDFIIWDNLMLQHARPDLSHCTRRRLQRSSVAEDNPFEKYCTHFNGRENVLMQMMIEGDPNVGRWTPVH